MKKLIFLAFLTVSGSALAQVAGPVGAPPQSPAKGSARLDRKEIAKIREEVLAKLDLTEDQKAKIKAHDTEMDKKRQELRKSLKGAAKTEETKEQMKEKQKALRKEDQEFLKSILSKPQLRQMQKLQREAIKERLEKLTPATGP